MKKNKKNKIQTSGYYFTYENRPHPMFKDQTQKFALLFTESDDKLIKELNTEGSKTFGVSRFSHKDTIAFFDGFLFTEKTEAEYKNSYYVRTDGYLGNAFMWWKKGRQGYTCDIKDAHVFTKEEAEDICKRPEDTAYKCEYIDKLLTAQKLIIDSQYVDKKEELFRN